MTGKENRIFLETVTQSPAACHQATVAVIIPTKNRPELLAEAIDSALTQTHPPHEIIVVDDGSTPPVNASKLKERYGPTVHVIHNDQSWGLAYSRNRGVEEASAEYVIHLDDDDLLAGDAIEHCFTVFREFADTDMVMFAAKGFGANSEYFNRVQPEGVKDVIRLGKGVEVEPNIIAFGQNLFPALLKKVPIAFQRVMSRKEIWQSVSQLRRQIYCLDSSASNEDSIKKKISGPLRDSEWSRYASLIYERIVFINRAIYLQRCAGQGYSSKPANRQLHILQGIEILEHLAQGAERVPKLMKWKSEIRTALAQAYFDAAYNHQKSENRHEAWQYLKKTVLTRIKPQYLKLALFIWFNAGVGRIKNQLKRK